MNISSLIKSRRKERKLSQSELAERAGVALNVVKNIEGDKTNVTLASLLKVLNVFGLKIRIE